MLAAIARARRAEENMHATYGCRWSMIDGMSACESPMSMAHGHVSWTACWNWQG